MITEVKSWEYLVQRKPYVVTVADELKNTMALNFCFNVEVNRLMGSDIFLLLGDNLKNLGYKCEFYGVGNFGFKFIDPFGIVATDGKTEGQFNDPSNDFDVVTVTNCDHQTWKLCTNKAIDEMKRIYGDRKSPLYFHWAKIEDQKWHSSNFDIPDYCSFIYSRPNGSEQSHTEIHHVKKEGSWRQELFSKYSPWYSTRIGFPIVKIFPLSDGELQSCIWQPFTKEIDKQKPHEVKIAVPENFGADARDILQATRIVFGVIQASISTGEPAHLAQSTIDVLYEGCRLASKLLTNEQRTNAINRLKTIVHRAHSLQDELRYHCYINETEYPFEKFATPEDVIIYNLDKIGWGTNVLGKTVREFLN